MNFPLRTGIVFVVATVAIGVPCSLWALGWAPARRLNVDAASALAADPGSMVLVFAADESAACGPSRCDPGQVCCNASCGICGAPGVPCNQMICGVPPPVSVMCGRNTCNVGQVCCNASCGVCAAPGVPCNPQACSGGPTMPESVACGMNTCNVGEVCCNASCGICAAPGASCAEAPCGP